MKYLLLFIFCFLLNNSFLYWEDLSEIEQKEIIQNGVQDESILAFLRNGRKLENSKQTMLLLNILSNLSINEKGKPLYFDIFNQICLNTDGELGEILGTYCQKIILSNIEYVIYYLKYHPKLSTKYEEFLGMEFYFKNDGVSDMKYNFSDFRNIINKKLSDKSEYQDFLISFYNKISLNMLNME